MYRRIVFAVVLISIGLFSSGYVLLILDNGIPATWPSSGFPIRMQIWNGFTDQLPMIVDGSNPKFALRTALEQWAQVSNLTIVASEGSADTVGQDGTSVVTIADNATNKNAVGSALGVSLISTLSNSSTSQIVETDVIFNPAETWSTLESSSDANNLFDVALHEFGHSWNLRHSINRSSTMYFQGGQFGLTSTQLAWDDVAGINALYPIVGLDQITGSISGKVTRGGSAIFGAFVVAVDESGVLSASAISLRDGMYQMKFLPPGKYTLYVEPLDGPMGANAVTGGIYDTLPGLVTDFLPKFFNDSRTPSATVNAGSDTPNQDFGVTTGNATIDPHFIGTVANANSGFQVFTSPSAVFQGVNTNVILGGKGSDKLLADQGVSFLGSSVGSGVSARKDNLSNGDPFQIFPVSIPLNAPKGEYTIVMQSNPETGFVTGGLELFSPFRFLQAFAQFAHIPNAATSGLFLINTNLAKSATGKISARGGPGTRTAVTIGSLSRDVNNDLDFTLKPGGSVSAQSGGTGTFLGSVRAEADRRIVGTALFETTSGTTGVGPSQPLFTFIAPVDIKGRGTASNTGVAATNLEERAMKLFIQVNDANGTLVAKIIKDLAGNAHLARFINDSDMIPGLPMDFKGTVVVTSNRRMAATVIRTSPGVFTTFPVVQNRISSRSFFGQFAHAGSLTSELLLVNPSPLRSATVLIQVRNSIGTAARVTLEGGEVLPDGRKTVPISPLGVVSLKTAGSDTLVGSVEISSSDTPVGGVVLFSSPALGTAGVGESFSQTKVVIPISRNKGASTDTGIAGVNTEDRSVKLKVTVRDTDGNVVGAPNKEITLAARQQLARFPNEDPFSLNLPDNFTGSIWIEADGLVALTVIRQSPGILTTFPAITLEQFLTPAD